MFKAQVIGRLGKDASIYESSTTGVKFLTFTIAVNTKNGGDDKTYWIDVRSFNPNHLKLVSYLTKGKALSIGGDFNTGTMTDKSGTVRITHNMVCDYINFVNIGGNNGNKSENTSSNTQNPQASTTVAPDEEISMGKVPVSVGAPTPTPVSDSNGEGDDLPF